jgi:hypothetical protein
VDAHGETSRSPWNTVECPGALIASTAPAGDVARENRLDSTGEDAARYAAATDIAAASIMRWRQYG